MIGFGTIRYCVHEEGRYCTVSHCLSRFVCQLIITANGSSSACCSARPLCHLVPTVNKALQRTLLYWAQKLSVLYACFVRCAAVECISVCLDTCTCFSVPDVCYQIYRDVYPRSFVCVVCLSDNFESVKRFRVSGDICRC